MSSQKHAKALWKACVDYHTFFRLNRNATTKTTSKQSKQKYFTCCNTAQKNADFGEQPLQQQQQSTKLIEPIKHTQSIAENRLNEKVSRPTDQHATSTNGNGNGKLSLLAIPKTHKTYDKQMETIPRMAWEQQP